jgi:apolipoprotein N-acyltransferase
MFVQKRMLLRSIAAVLIAGGCWWLSFDLGLHWWLPIWLAPVPVLWMAQRLSGRGAFGAAFLAFLIGRCAWLGYLLSVLPAAPALLFTILPALCFALAVLPARVFFRRKQPVLAALSFAALWTSIEFLLALFGRDGTIVSIAYTQSSFLPVVQVAALTGVAGISFVLCFVPALVAGRKWVLAGAVVVGVIAFGLVRLGTGKYGEPVKVGMAAVPESAYGGRVNEPRAAKEMVLLDQYCGEIGKLAVDGIAVVVLPEKALPFTHTTEKIFHDSLAQLATRCKIKIVDGATLIDPQGLGNLAHVFGPSGILASYKKVHLFEGEVLEGFESGSNPCIFEMEGIPTGLAICKDLDFEHDMRSYGRAGIGVMYAPAWDFVRDGWWHSRVAIVGAVSNGYTLVRNAREGRMTISDDRGRIQFETSSESRQLTTMTGVMRTSTARTLYSRWGDWFGWLMVVTAAVVLIYLAASRSLTRV